jgi:hypothetical protein
MIVKREVLYEGVNAPGAEPPPPPPKPPTPPPPRVVLRDTGITEEYLHVLERVHNALEEELRELREKQHQPPPTSMVEDQVSDDWLNGQISEGNALMESLRVDNERASNTYQKYIAAYREMDNL